MKHNCSTKFQPPCDSFIVPTTKEIDGSIVPDISYDLKIFGTPSDYEIQNLVNSGVPIEKVPFEKQSFVPDDSLFDTIENKLDDNIIVNPNSDDHEK